MTRWLYSLAVLSMGIGQVWADDTDKAASGKEAAAKVAPAKLSAADNLKANPNENAAFIAFMNEWVSSIYSAVDKNPAEAEKKLAEMKAVLAAVKPDVPEAQTRISRAEFTVRALGDMIELSRVSLADLEAKVDANPQDLATVTKYMRKASQQITSLARSEPDQAEKILNGAKGRLEKIAGSASNETKTTIQNMLKSLANYQRSIDSGKKLLALIGQDAAPLEVETWVNGTSLSDQDLKGKVVLLDFWAVWCGPCIATFPHLKEWQEKYADKGLVIIGLTNYYNYAWDAEGSRAKRSTEPVAPDAEQDMLQQFAAHHGLHHRFGVQPKGSKTSEYYGVTGIPHVVVIDQSGKIRLMRVGSGEKNAHDVGAMIEKLLAQPAQAGS